MAEPKIGLTIFLVRKSQVASFEEAMAKLYPAPLSLAPPFDGYFLPLPSTPSVPRWVGDVSSILRAPSGLVLDSQAPAGLLVVRRHDRTFVVTFGHAWQKLQNKWLESDYGRRVALNALRRDQLVEIRAEQVLGNWHLASERAPRASSIDDFGVEFDRDLVAAVEGVTTDHKLGKKIRGGTNLRLHVPFSQLATVLDRSRTLFNSTEYRKIWPELDNLTQVDDAELIRQIEDKLDVHLRAGEAQKTLVMFTPSQRRQLELSVDSYVFGRMAASPTTRPYLTVDGWQDVLASHGGTPSLAEAKNTRIHLLDDAGEELGACTAFECFGYELTHQGRLYVLSSGVWYEAIAAFLSQINGAVKGIPSITLTLPRWNQVESEGQYNTRCGKIPGFEHFDAKNVLFGGGQSKFEFCDLLHMKSKSLVFVKIASKSSGMSHLLEQVRRTTELFFSSDGTFRRKLAKTIVKRDSKADVAWLDSRPRQGDWKLCLVSMGRTVDRLPFFAKCGLARLYKDLRERGHEVSFGAV